MLTLCGFSASNYYNKVKLALLEKGLPFTEELAWVGETDRSASPLGKVPYLRTPQGALCESAVIADYIEAAHPDHPLIPADPYQAAKVRELITFLELHLELVARNLYPQAFFGGTVSDTAKEKVGLQLQRTSPPSASWPSSAPTWAATPSPWPTARPSCTCRWSARPPRSSMARTIWPTCPCATTWPAWPSAPMCSA